MFCDKRLGVVHINDNSYATACASTHSQAHISQHASHGDDASYDSDASNDAPHADGNSAAQLWAVVEQAPQQPVLEPELVSVPGLALAQPSGRQPRQRRLGQRQFL
jgi:hypothetical protein